MLVNTGQYIRTCDSLNEAKIVESVLVQLGTWDIQEAGFSEFFNNFVVIATPKVGA